MKVLAATLALAALLAAPAGTDIAGYRDDARGVSALVPDGWHAAGPLTALVFPREVVTLASFALRRGGSCGPGRALADLGPRDALVTVLEYRPPRGAVWGRGTRRSQFPRRPRHLRLPAGAPGSPECIGRPAYLLRFRDAGRPLQVVVALGTRVSAADRRTVERVLDGLRFDALPAPSADP
jgi:hypothetical protein